MRHQERALLVLVIIRLYCVHVDHAPGIYRTASTAVVSEKIHTNLKPPPGNKSMDVRSALSRLIRLTSEYVRKKDTRKGLLTNTNKLTTVTLPKNRLYSEPFLHLTRTIAHHPTLFN